LGPTFLRLQFTRGVRVGSPFFSFFLFTFQDSRIVPIKALFFVCCFATSCAGWYTHAFSFPQRQQHSFANPMVGTPFPLNPQHSYLDQPPFSFRFKRLSFPFNRRGNSQFYTCTPSGPEATCCTCSSPLLTPLAYLPACSFRFPR